jgi:hypothetical protein
MQMNIPTTFGPICFSGSLEEDLNVSDGRRTTSDGNSSGQQAANQVLLFFGPIENPRWPPTGDII